MFEIGDEVYATSPTGVEVEGVIVSGRHSSNPLYYDVFLPDTRELISCHVHRIRDMIVKATPVLPDVGDRVRMKSNGMCGVLLSEATFAVPDDPASRTGVGFFFLPDGWSTALVVSLDIVEWE